MSRFATRLFPLTLAGLFALAFAAPTAHAQIYPGFRISATGGGLGYGPRAGFYRPGVTNPLLRTSAYRNASDIYSGYLTGAASAIGAAQANSLYGYGYGYGYYPPDPYSPSEQLKAEGQFYQDVEKSRLTREQVRQSKIETRRKAFDEYLYERNLRPTTEDEREKARIEYIRRSYNDPPVTEIWSGLALNNLLQAIQKMEKQAGPGPNVVLNSEILSNINVTAGGQTGNLGPFKNGGKLQWPLALRGSAYNTDRKRMDQLAAQAFAQAQGDAVAPDTLDAMSKCVDRLTATLLQNVPAVAPNEYIRAKRYLNDLSDGLQALQDPQVANYATGKWSAQGNTVSELVANMSRNGLRFGPANPGDHAAYNALHTALVSYYTWPRESWDPLAK
jgi:hypothetical protein